MTSQPVWAHHGLEHRGAPFLSLAALWALSRMPRRTVAASFFGTLAPAGARYASRTNS